MTEDAKQPCVLLPCSSAETWAVPQNTLGEILTVHSDSEQPPTEVSWRGHTVPVMDLGKDDGSVWREPGRSNGLVAIFLGLKGDACPYWGVAVRGKGLGVVDLQSGEVANTPDDILEYATAAFEFQGIHCQVPDFDRLQKQIAASQ